MKTVLIVEDLELNRDLLAHIPVIVLSAHAMSGDGAGTGSRVR